VRLPAAPPKVGVVSRSALPSAGAVSVTRASCRRRTCARPVPVLSGGVDPVAWAVVPRRAPGAVDRPGRCRCASRALSVCTGEAGRGGSGVDLHDDRSSRRVRSPCRCRSGSCPGREPVGWVRQRHDRWSRVDDERGRCSSPCARGILLPRDGRRCPRAELMRRSCRRRQAAARRRQRGGDRPSDIGPVVDRHRDGREVACCDSATPPNVGVVSFVELPFAAP
jgi:hypothetical protein